MASKMHKVQCKLDGLENSSDVCFKDFQHQLKEQSDMMNAIEWVGDLGFSAISAYFSGILV